MLLNYEKSIIIHKSINDCFNPIESIGGKNGWYYWNFLWKIRSLIDKVLGGPGDSKGRKHQTQLNVNDYIDWWIVKQIKKPYLLKLHSQMKNPGNAWLTFQLKKITHQQTQLTLIATFKPFNAIGTIYWFSLYPIHALLFTGLLKQIKKKSHH